MAGKKENIKALFSNTRSRVIILFTLVLLLIAVTVGIIKFTSSLRTSEVTGTNLGVAPAGIQSVPGSINPTAQYASLQETQNIEQAQTAAKSGSSAIPTIIRTQAFGEGVEAIGPQNGEGAVGFETLAREDSGGPQQSLWIQSLKDSNCSKASVSSVVSQGAVLSDLKGACSCTQLKDDGYQFADLETVCSCKELKAAGFSARQMKDTGFTASRLRQCGFDACELRGAGFTAQEMKDGGYSDGELKGAGFSDNDIARAGGLPEGMTADDVRKAGCDAAALSRLRVAGVTASAIRRISGCSATQLNAAGFTAQDLKNAGFSAADLLNAGFTQEQLRDAGYIARDLLDAGLTPAQLAAAGFTSDQLKAAEAELPPGMIPDDVKAARCSVGALKRERLAGVSAALIHQYAGCSAESLKSAGFTENDLANAGFTPAQISAASSLMSDDAIKAAGCDPVKLKGLFLQGVSAKRIRDLNGCSAQALKDAGYDAKALTDAGFTPQQLLAVGFTPQQINTAQSVSDAAVKAAGCDPTQLKKLFAEGVSAKRIHDLNGCSAEALKNAGYNAQELAAAGFTPQELLAAGFTPAEVNAAKGIDDAAINAAGCDSQKLHALFLQGVSAKRIHDLNGCSAEALKNAGYNAQDLAAAGFSPQELLAAGFTPAEVVAAKAVDDAAIRAAGCDPQKLHALFLQGVPAKRIHDLNGCSADALKNAGFDAQELAAAGFTPQQLLAAGFTPAEVNAAKAKDDAAISAAGCDSQKLHALFLQGVSAKRIHDLNGCSAEALKNAGYNAQDLAAAGFSPQELLAAGFTPAEVVAAKAVDDAAIRAAGCDPQKLHALFLQGVPAKRIHDLNGCSADALKNAGFDAQELAAAGFTPQQLLAAGFTPAELNAGQTVDDATIRAAGCDSQKLHALFLQGVTATRIHDLNGCSADALKNAGFDAKELADAGFTPEQLLTAGFTPQQLREAGLTPAGVIAVGRTADCSAASLKAAHALGVSATTIKQTLGCSAKEMKDAGYTALELKNAGFTAAELKDAGFSAADLKNAGFSAKELRAAGFSAADLKNAGLTAAQLKDAGFSATDLKNAGFSPEQLKTAGYSAAELKDAGFSAEALRKARYSAKDLKDAGFSAGQLKNAGYSAQELQDAGYSPTDSSLAGLQDPNQPVIPSAVTVFPPIGGPLAGHTDSIEAANTKQLQDILKKQQALMADQRYQQKIQQRTNAMMGAASQSLQEWKTVTTQAYIGGSVAEKSTIAGVRAGIIEPAGPLASPGGPSTVGAKGLIKAGDVLFAVLDTSVNTDEPGPILATIVSGKLKGAKLIGSFTLPSNADKMVISFNTMSVPGAAKTTSINAYAIDPNTARTALASRANHHYLLRYGSLFASTFIEGIGNAFQSANTTITIGGVGDVSNTTIQNGAGRSILENAVIGLATLGKSWGQIAQQQFSLPTTVDLYSGTGIGVLFTQDLASL